MRVSLLRFFKIGKKKLEIVKNILGKMYITKPLILYLIKELRCIPFKIKKNIKIPLLLILLNRVLEVMANMIMKET